MTIPDPLIQFCEWLVKVTWQAAVLVLLVLLIQWVLGRKLTPVWRYNLWLIVLIRLALPVSPQGSWSIFNYPGLNREVVPIGQKFFGTEPEKEINAAKFSHTKEGIVEIVSIPFNSMIDMAYPIVTSLVEEGQNSKSGFIRWIFFKVDRMNLFICVWTAGFFFFGIRALRNYRLLFRHVNELDPVKDYRALRIWEDARQKINCAAEVTLVESDLVHSPALCGFLKYRLLLPPGMIRHFSDAELKMVFLHELAHLKRGDVQINWFATVFQLLHWFNPVLWWGLKCMRTDREIAADAMVLMNSDGKERKAYGRTIIRLLEGFSPTPSAGMVGLLEDDEQFKSRIQTMATFKGPIPSWSLLGCCVVMLLGAVGLTDRPVSPLVNESAASINEQGELSTDIGDWTMAGVGIVDSYFEDSGDRSNSPISDIEAKIKLDVASQPVKETLDSARTASGPVILKARDLVNLFRPYGTWVNHPKFGVSWVPNVSRWNRSWRPFRDYGHWSKADDGFLWNSDYVWGGIAFYYGNWVKGQQTHQWLWVPDGVYSSARVHWRETSAYLGWAPRKPGEEVPANEKEVSKRNEADYMFVAKEDLLYSKLENAEISPYWNERVLRQSKIVIPAVEVSNQNNISSENLTSWLGVEVAFNENLISEIEDLFGTNSSVSTWASSVQTSTNRAEPLF